MRVWVYLPVLFLLCLNPLTSQELITRSFEFNDLYYGACPHNRNLTLTHNKALRKKHRIKTITRKLDVGKFTNKYSDSLIRINPRENFTNTHTSVIDYYLYDSTGLLAAKSCVPLNVKLSPTDSAYYEFVKITKSNSGKIYKIEYYNKNSLYQEETYEKGLLKEQMYYSNLYWVMPDKSGKDVRQESPCRVTIGYEYTKKGQLKKRTYNNVHYYFPEFKNPCGIMESESYEYKRGELIITKPIWDSILHAKKYVNRIVFHKSGQIYQSFFCYDHDWTVKYVKTCVYDEHDNLTGIYEVIDDMDPLEDQTLSYENKYTDDKKLLSITDNNQENYKKTYYFNSIGLLVRIEYDEGEVNELFEYTFY